MTYCDGCLSEQPEDSMQVRKELLEAFADKVRLHVAFFIQQFMIAEHHPGVTSQSEVQANIVPT